MHVLGLGYEMLEFAISRDVVLVSLISLPLNSLYID